MRYDVGDELQKLKRAGAIELVKEPEAATPEPEIETFYLGNKLPKKKSPARKPEAENPAGIPPEEPSGLVMLDTVTPESINWLWQGRIPLGKLTVIDGDPGLGKSTVTLDLAARVSRGLPMPDGSTGIEGGAVIISMEDGLADTIVPRFMAAGADLSRIVALQTVHDGGGGPRIPTVEDIEAIKRACERVQAKIVVVDPLMAHLDGRVNSFKDQEVRKALTPLIKIAEDTGIAVIVNRHLNKSGGGKPYTGVAAQSALRGRPGALTLWRKTRRTRGGECSQASKTIWHQKPLLCLSPSKGQKFGG